MKGMNSYHATRFKMTHELVLVCEPGVRDPCFSIKLQLSEVSVLQSTTENAQYCSISSSYKTKSQSNSKYPPLACTVMNV